MGNAIRDLNYHPVTLGVDSTDATKVSPLKINPVTGRVLVDVSGSGHVSGPVSSTDNAVVRWNGTGGSALQDSTTILSDTGELAIVSTGTTTNCLTVTGNSITTGGIALLTSNSADTSTRNLLYIKNDNTAAVGTAGIYIQQDALVDTNFKKYVSYDGTVTWVSDGTDPNGNLTGSAGDICLNGPSNVPYYCTGTTNWATLIPSDVDTLQTVFDRGQTITVANTDNQTLVITQNDTTNNPDAVQIVNAGTGDSLFIDQNGNGRSIYIDSEATGISVLKIDAVNATGHVLDVDNQGIQTTEVVGHFNQGNASSSSGAVDIVNAGTGNALFIDQNGNGSSIDIDSEATTATVLNIDSQSTIGQILKITNNGIHTNSLAVFAELNASSTGSTIFINNKGTGTGLEIDKDNSGMMIELDQDVNDANPCYGIQMNIANAGAGLEHAFKFDGSEIVSAAVGGSQDKKITIDIAGTTYYIPCHTA